MKSHIVKHLPTFLLLLAVGVIVYSCSNDPFSPPPGVVIGDPNNPTSDTPCDPNKIYYRDIQSIFSQYCVMCHNGKNDTIIIDEDDDTVTTDLMLTSYQALMDYNKNIREIIDLDKTDDPSESELYELITNTDHSKWGEVMPFGGPNIPNDAIKKIEQWIRQGADSLKCDDCNLDTAFITYSNVIQGTLSRCTGCHSPGYTKTNLDLLTHEDVKAAITDSVSTMFLKRIKHDNSISDTLWMPQGQDPLDDCSIDQIEIWIANKMP